MGIRENLKSELKYQDLKVKNLADKAGIPKRTIDGRNAQAMREFY